MIDSIMFPFPPLPYIQYDWRIWQSFLKARTCEQISSEDEQISNPVMVNFLIFFFESLFNANLLPNF